MGPGASALPLWAGALAAYGGGLALVLAELRRSGRAAAEHRSPAQRVAVAGLFAALAALLQGSAAFWPGLGHLLASLSALPVAVGVLAAPEDAAALVLAAAGLLAVVQVHQSAVFLMTTAPLGVASAWAATDRRHPWLRWLLPGVILSGGILTLVNLVGVPVFGGLARSRGVAVATLVYVAFGLIYAPLWVVFLRASGFSRPHPPPGGRAGAAGPEPASGQS
jgi:hypothetical protein